MTFEFDDRFAMFDVTPVDNQFIQEYLPNAKGDYVRVYLYGLMRCYHPEEDMNIDRMSHELNMSDEDVLSAYRYWERRGLVRRISDEPPAYRYVNIKQKNLSADDYADPDYEAFAESLYGVFGNSRRLHGSEIRTCYEWVEELKLTPEAVIMLLKHMAATKGKNFTVASAGKLAAQMADEQISTAEDAEEFLSGDRIVTEGTRKILRRLGKRNLPSEDQLALYRKWTNEWGFSHEAIETACTETVKGDPNMGYLDGILNHMRASASGPIGKAGVQAAQAKNERIRAMLNILGRGNINNETVRAYDEMESMYTDNIICMAARECARKGGRPDDVLKLLTSWYRKGLKESSQIEEYINTFHAQNELIREMKKMWGTDERVGETDRKMLTVWEQEFGMGPELILVAAASASEAKKPMVYLDRILHDCATHGIRTVEAFRNGTYAHQPNDKCAREAGNRKVTAQQYEQRDYSDVQESPEDMMNRLNGGRKPDA